MHSAKREQALEDEFFHRVDEKLRAELRKSMDRDRSREALTEATGLTDPELLDALIEAGFQATTLDRTRSGSGDLCCLGGR